MLPPSGDVAVVIPARDESDRIRATVTAAAGLPGVDVVVVVDDGSRDGTAATAENAGATVLRHPRSRGKSAAMETGAEAVRLMDGREHRGIPRHLLFLDADLAESAKADGTTADGEFSIILLGTILISMMVVTTNRLVWRPLYRLAETRYRLDA